MKPTKAKPPIHTLYDGKNLSALARDYGLSELEARRLIQAQIAQAKAATSVAPSQGTADQTTAVPPPHHVVEGQQTGNQSGLLLLLVPANWQGHVSFFPSSTNPS